MGHICKIIYNLKRLDAPKCCYFISFFFLQFNYFFFFQISLKWYKRRYPILWYRSTDVILHILLKWLMNSQVHFYVKWNYMHNLVKPFCIFDIVLCVHTYLCIYIFFNFNLKIYFSNRNDYNNNNCGDWRTHTVKFWRPLRQMLQ